MTNWISVEDRLPEPSNWVLIYASTESPVFDEKVVTMAYFEQNLKENENYWLCHNDYGSRSEWENVTHWMPLPEPPQGKTND